MLSPHTTSAPIASEYIVKKPMLPPPSRTWHWSPSARKRQPEAARADARASRTWLSGSCSSLREIRSQGDGNVGHWELCGAAQQKSHAPALLSITIGSAGKGCQAGRGYASVFALAHSCDEQPQPTGDIARRPIGSDPDDTRSPVAVEEKAPSRGICCISTRVKLRAVKTPRRNTKTKTHHGVRR